MSDPSFSALNNKAVVQLALTIYIKASNKFGLSLDRARVCIFGHELTSYCGEVTTTFH